MGCRPWGRTESDRTEATEAAVSVSMAISISSLYYKELTHRIHVDGDREVPQSVNSKLEAQASQQLDSMPSLQGLRTRRAGGPANDKF